MLIKGSSKDLACRCWGFVTSKKTQQSQPRVWCRCCCCCSAFMPDGGRAGQVTGSELAAELQAKAKREAKQFAALGTSVTGRGADTVSMFSLYLHAVLWAYTITGCLTDSPSISQQFQKKDMLACGHYAASYTVWCVPQTCSICYAYDMPDARLISIRPVRQQCSSVCKE